MMLVTIGSSIDNIKPKDIQGIEESKHNLGRKIIKKLILNNLSENNYANNKSAE